MKLAEMLERDRNNLDIIQTLAASMVIYGHAYSIAPEAGHSDWVQRVLGFGYSGSLAVKILFFISGLVVTNSLFIRRSVTAFVFLRVFRIWPAFMVFLTVFICGAFRCSK